MKDNGLFNLTIGVLIALLAIVLGSRFIVGYLLVDLHDFFAKDSMIYNMVHTNYWILAPLIGTLVAILQKAARESKLWESGLKEWRDWRNNQS
jgi:hypothetical protein